MLTPVAKRSRVSSRRQFGRSKSTTQGLNMALLIGGLETLLLAAIDMALLAEGKKCKLPRLCGTHTSESYKSHFESHPAQRAALNHSCFCRLATP